jgi:uncharacterized cupin superfamily protein
MGFRVAHTDGLEWIDRPGVEGAPSRRFADLTTAAGLEHSRARFWRFPAGSKGRRHAEGSQEEVFVVLEGVLTIALGEPPEWHRVERAGVVCVDAGTPLQLFNREAGELELLIWGAPPVTGAAVYHDDLEPPPA